MKPQKGRGQDCMETAETNTEPAGFFQEPSGMYSTTRLMSFTSLLAAIAFGLLTVLGKAGPDGPLITLAFLGAGVGQKLIQKPLEKAA